MQTSAKSCHYYFKNTLSFPTLNRIEDDSLVKALLETEAKTCRVSVEHVKMVWYKVTYVIKQRNQNCDGGLDIRS